MRHLPVQNPVSRFVTTAVDYDDGEAPNAELEVYEDQTRNIVSGNDSPDVGFRWSVNPYRGCFHACAYCLDGDTPILMADATTKRLGDLRVGDAIYGTTSDGGRRRYVHTEVRAHWETQKRAYRITLEDGTELVASGDHRFLTLRGWKYVTPVASGPARPHLTVGTKMMGFGAFTRTPATTSEYMRGYVSGIFRAASATKGNVFRLPLADLEALQRTRAYLAEGAGVACSSAFLAEGAKPSMAFRTGDEHTSAIERTVDWPYERSAEWARGFLAGLFDAEGTFSKGNLRVSSATPRVLEEALVCFRMLDFDVAVEPPVGAHAPSKLRMRGELRDKLRFLHLVAPALRRKWNIEGVSIKSRADLRVASIEDLGTTMRLFDITTSTGDFVANGVVSHNCYARPTHEYLSFGAGTDFERKIVMKPRAPELLRETFDKPSWKGELVVFSGVTDCYQPLEREMRLTRGCMEVCAEYRNPVGIITKSPVVERDVDVFQELARNASVRVNVSIPFWDPAVARAMEPMVTVPERRMKIIETLAKAGIPVGIGVAPIIPGLNDDHLGELLERARDAGAMFAFFVLLRLPGPVKDVFERSIRAKLPLRADKVFRRLREAHGGEVYDSSYGTRGRGSGVYAETIRALFERTTKRLGLDSDPLETYKVEPTFRRPDRSGQMSFGF